MNALQPQELLEQAKVLNKTVETGYLTLAVILSQIEETKAYESLGYESFQEYSVNELNRSKGTISKLLKVGKWLRDCEFQTETLDTSYARLYESINLNKDKDPQFILASAQTNTQDELEEEKRMNKFGEHEHIPSEEMYSPCTVCTKHIRVK